MTAGIVAAVRGRMLNHRLAYAILLPVLALYAACGDDAPATSSPDARATAPLDPTGGFALRSEFSLTAPPRVAADVLAELASATDGPDDPSRYVVDRLIAKLPEGYTRLAAIAVAPFLAAYLQQRIDGFAPTLAVKLRALSAGLNRVAHHFGTTEKLGITPGGRVAHTFTGLRFDGAEMAFAPAGLADVPAQATWELSGDRLTIGEHAATLPYGTVLRVGLDRTVVPAVVPGAADLADALAEIIDCDHLGGLVADFLSFGPDSLYGGACSLAVVALAAEIYERLEAEPVHLRVAGSARVVDLNGDGPVDVISDGQWSGTFADMTLAPSSFDGAAP